MTIELVKLEDPFEIKTMLFKDNLYINIIDKDYFYKWIPEFKLTLWFSVLNDNTPIGIIFFREVSYKVVSFHGGIYKKFRGTNSSSILKFCLDHVRSQIQCSFITTVPSKNILALELDKKVGFEVIKTIKNGCADDDLCLLAEKEV